ncbi:unnamed protein product [Polarella glacialis]|uniref:Uncharacterized protein n=1 Tax=Polarella glacialis TaxID=89957 RepID=A0A813DRD2_POLGL|nr:unnamed protein product [Polarella glacialis]CAE8723598.1 unnamed protein product [Polarella glacialis]
MSFFISRALRSGHLSSYSAVGKWSHFSFRQRYTLMLKNQTDPTIADFFYEKWLHAWVADPPSYNYWFVSSMAFGACVGILTRQIYFNPDVYFRKQEVRKPLPDRHRQWTFSLPFYNHRLRNMVAKYRWCMIDNEPDWIDNHPLGYRPNRKQCHRRPYMWIFTVPRYSIEDPLYTSVTFENMNRIYEEVGYVKKAKTEED